MGKMQIGIEFDNPSERDYSELRASMEREGFAFQENQRTRALYSYDGDLAEADVRILASEAVRRVHKGFVLSVIDLAHGTGSVAAE